MRELNKVTLIGNITNAIEIQRPEDSISVARFLLTTADTFEDSKGQLQAAMEQHSIVLRSELAELAYKYLKTGYLIFLEGKLKIHQVDDAEGQTRYITEIMGEHLVLLNKGKATWLDE